MLMGRKVLEALLVFQKVNVQMTILELKPKKTDKKLAIDDPSLEEQKIPFIEMDQAYRALNYENIHKELSENKALVKMTEGHEDGNGGGSSGSESDPSEDNLDEAEIAELVPLKPSSSNGKKKTLEKKKPLPEVKPPKKK